MSFDFNTCNEEQVKAIKHFEGPLLILAGAGSGKTRVLTHRIAYLIDEYCVSPYHIMALTFTNKAANEMRERVDKIVDFGAEAITVGTFHSICVRILRRYIDRLGYDRSFNIYDADDQKSLMKDIIKRRNLDPKKFKERTFLSAISNQKNILKTPKEYKAEVAKEFNKRIYGDIYEDYQNRLEQNNALDFDDLIMLTVKLFEENPDVLDMYQERYQFLMVDEYQDTNHAQFRLIHLLAKKYGNLCVVGDDDQSIYKFRGANISNILDFEKFFPGTEVIKLEQNYRSTKHILDAANNVIANNTHRKAKALWTDKGEGEPIKHVIYFNEYEEAAGVADDISHKISQNGCSYKDFAILYRTNAQSRPFEEKLVLEGIPYRIVGAINFYSRKEIKDLLCYLKTVNNPSDDISVKRIINIPRRGIGAASISRISEYAELHGISFYDALKDVDYIDGCSRAARGINSFVGLIENAKKIAESPSCSLIELFDYITEVTGYIKDLENEDSVEAESRLENIESLINKIKQYEDDMENLTDEEATLNGLLENIALISDIDNVSEDTEQVLLMTLHSSKGLEFPNVYICGMEDGIFPSGQSMYNLSDEDLQEERRLCYVGITRAMETLTITSARQRMRNGETCFNPPSRFINEIPRHLLTEKNNSGMPTSSSSSFTDLSSFGASQSKKPRNKYFSTKPMTMDNNPFIKKGADLASSSKPDYDVGDKVYHIKFGTGTVTSMKQLDSGDYEVGVEFSKSGPRKLRSSFAKLLKQE
ncbi:ATP-dependent helicase [Eubacterium xylanophilum]|uniref:ATP-dependent helicase n=1 Tax=Eubacterium xylanophilum TaxID=39497 RepID=UPI0004799108|nr:UvrD-helicase domain-containing protein [Eubacterium xylanophilum]